MKKQEKSFFITVEGGEGVGKSLFLKKLSEALSAYSIKHIVTREPGGTVIAEKLRAIFNDPECEEALTVEAEFLIVSAARAQHIKNRVLPALNSGKSVLCDRFVDSSRVYQGALGGLSSEFIEGISRACLYGVSAGVTFLLDCESSLSLSRLEKRTALSSEEGEKKTRYDAKSFSFHKAIREAFLDLARKNPERIKVLDASLEPDMVVDEALKALKGLEFL